MSTRPVQDEMKGVIVALPTGFSDDNTITFTAYRKHMDACIAAGVHGFWINGCSGLAVYLTEAERRQALEVAVEHNAGRVPLWVHTGAMATRESVALAQHARQFEEVVGVSTLPPLFYGTSVEGVVAHMTAIQAAARLPITFYHVPGVTHVLLDADQLGTLYEQVPDMVAIKYSDQDMFKAMVLKQRHPAMRLMTGYEEVLLSGLALGAFDGTVGAGQNFMPAPFVDIYNLFLAGDLEKARRISMQVARLMDIQGRFDFTAAAYAFLNLLGFEYGRPRAPMLGLTEADCRSVQVDSLVAVKPDPFEEKRLIRSDDFLDE